MINVDQGVKTVAPVLLLQLFAAASGFMVPARRGHYDLLLTRGDSRLAIAVVHWAMSILPGVLSWFVLAAIERMYGGNEPRIRRHTARGVRRFPPCHGR